MVKVFLKYNKVFSIIIGIELLVFLLIFLYSYEVIWFYYGIIIMLSIFFLSFNQKLLSGEHIKINEHDKFKVDFEGFNIKRDFEESQPINNQLELILDKINDKEIINYEQLTNELQQKIDDIRNQIQKTENIYETEKLIQELRVDLKNLLNENINPKFSDIANIIQENKKNIKELREKLELELPHAQIEQIEQFKNEIFDKIEKKFITLDIDKITKNFENILVKTINQIKEQLITHEKFIDTDSISEEKKELIYIKPENKKFEQGIKVEKQLIKSNSKEDTPEIKPIEVYQGYNNSIEDEKIISNGNKQSRPIESETSIKSDELINIKETKSDKIEKQKQLLLEDYPKGIKVIENKFHINTDKAVEICKFLLDKNNQDLTEEQIEKIINKISYDDLENLDSGIIEKILSEKPEKEKETQKTIELIDRIIEIVELNQFDDIIEYKGHKFRIQKNMHNKDINDFKKNEERLRKFFANRTFIICYSMKNNEKNYYIYYKV
ncbi:MAG: hypothetical protein ACP6IY_18580 [Promethearchaeia archaeon]